MKVKDLYKEGQRLLVEGKLEESIDAFMKALDEGEEPYMIYLSRGVAYMNLGKTESAIEDFTKALFIDDTRDRPFYYRGIANMIMEEYGRAIDDFTRAIKIKSHHPQARLARGVSYARLGLLDEASADISAVIPEMEANVQKFVDEYGIVRTELWKVMAQLSGERETPVVELTDEEIDTLKKWVEQE